MADQDLTLSFDPKEFQAGIASLITSIGNIEKRLGDVAGSTTKMEKSGAKSIGLWSAVMTKGLGLIGSGVNKIMSFIPEIGKSFSIAGDIISRNLLWPLRQELIPILQKMLNWVRDHRTMFVKWGMVIANIFRMIAAIVKAAFQFWEKMFNRLALGLKKVFGNSVKSVTDLINIIIFRIALLVTVLQVLLEPVMTFLVDSFVTLVKLAKEFATSFSRGFGGIGAAIGDIVKQLQTLFSIFGEGQTDMMPFIQAFGYLGEALGMLLRTVFTPLMLVFQAMVGGLKMMAVIIKYVVAAAKGEKPSFVGMLKDLKNVYGRQTEAMEETDSWDRKTNSGSDAATAAADKVITGAKPAFTPPKGKSGGGGNVNNIDNKQNITIHVNGAGSPAKVAEKVVDEIKKTQAVREGKRDTGKKL